MNYHALNELLETGKIDPMLWAMHFPDVDDDVVPTCMDCADFESEVCDGELGDPIECMIRRTEEFNRFMKENPDLPMASVSPLLCGMPNLRCPSCGSSDVEVQVRGSGDYIYCFDCEYSGPLEESVQVQKQTPRRSKKVGRNDPCPCGSGKKYKKCCWKKDVGLE